MKKGTFLATGLAVGLFVTTVAAEPLIYVAGGSANKLFIIDAATDTVVNEFDGIANPHAVVATPDGEYVVSGSLKEKQPPKGSDKAPESTVYLVHPEHGHVMLTFPAEGMIHHQTITPDGRYVISTHPTRGTISVSDLQSNTVVKTVATGAAPNYTLVTRDGAKAYVSNSGGASIAEVDTATWTVTRTLKAGPGPEHMVFSKDEKTIYVANARAGAVAVVSVETGEILRDYQIGNKVHGLGISEDGQRLFATSKKEKRLVVIGLGTDERKVVDLAPSPYHLEAIPGTGKVYVSSSKAPKIWVLSQATGDLISEIALPAGEGHQMAVIR